MPPARARAGRADCRSGCRTGSAARASAATPTDSTPQWTNTTGPRLTSRTADAPASAGPKAATISTMRTTRGCVQGVPGHGGKEAHPPQALLQRRHDAVLGIVLRWIEHEVADEACRVTRHRGGDGGFVAGDARDNRSARDALGLELGRPAIGQGLGRPWIVPVEMPERVGRRHLPLRRQRAEEGGREEMDVGVAESPGHCRPAFARSPRGRGEGRGSGFEVRGSRF